MRMLTDVLDECRAEVRRLEAELAALREWQPMSTAPQEKKPVLMLDARHGPVVARWRRGIGWSSVPGRYAVRGQGWRRLPAGPEGT